jgi:hypothetical protein
MRIVVVVFFLAGLYPLWRAWWANRQTTLLQSLHWSLAAWIAWAVHHAWPRETGPGELDAPRYVALCLSGCACIAVLGARRPQVGVWNFVVLGLLAVMVLPLVERLLPGAGSLDTMRVLFLAATVGVGVLNYLPTCFAGAALLLALGCSGELMLLSDAAWDDSLGFVSGACLALVPWAAWTGWARQRSAVAEFDALWLDFRNRYGLVWGQRLREQFNIAAVHAGWPVQLYWQGLVRLSTPMPLDSEVQNDIVSALKALLKRFRVDGASAEE